MTLAIPSPAVRWPRFMEPIDTLLKTTIEKTHIQPNFEAPKFLSLQSISIQVHGEIVFSLPNPPPSFPFRITLLHPIFESPVFVPQEFSQNEKTKNDKNSKKKNSSKKKDKKGDKKQRYGHTSAPGSSVCKPAQLEVTTDLQADVDQEVFDHYLNQYLIYFKSVEKRVIACLARTTGPTPSQKSMEDLSDLTTDLWGFIQRLDKFYTEQELIICEVEEREEFKEIVHCAARLQTIFERLDESNISAILQENIENTEDHILCSILGMDDKVAESLILLNHSVRTHQTDEYWILYFLEQKAENLQSNIGFESSFRELGFTVATAQHLGNILNHNPTSDHQTILYWAKKYICQQFSYHILLSPHRHVPINRDKTVDQSYVIDTIPDEENEPVSIPAINTKMLKSDDDLKNSDLLTEFMSQDGCTLEESVYWFHGTDHKSALKIMKEGIDLDKGKDGGDFSDGRGFYLTTNYSFAHWWSQSMMKKENSAVVVFKLQNKVFLERKGKQFLVDSDEWRSAVRYFRNKKDSSKCGVKKAKEFKGFPYMFGPISRDGSSVKLPNWSPKARIPTVFELCIKDDFMAEEFYNSGLNIYKTIFFH